MTKVTEPVKINTTEDLNQAVERVKSGELSLQEASKIYTIPKSTISVKKKAVFVEIGRKGPSTVLTTDEEFSLEKKNIYLFRNRNLKTS